MVQTPNKRAKKLMRDKPPQKLKVDLDRVAIREANWFYRQRTIALTRKHGILSRARMGMRIGQAGPGGDYSHSAIGTWELEQVAPPLADVARFAAAYEVSVEALEEQIVAQARRIRERNAAASGDRS